MNLVAHETSKAFVNELVSRNRPFAFECLGNDDRYVMGVVIAKDAGVTTG